MQHFLKSGARKHHLNHLLCVSAFLLSGCSTDKELNSDTRPLVGSDRDEHGCIGSAGYLWCEHTNQCERPWELANQKGFENTEKALSGYCNQPHSK